MSSSKITNEIEESKVYTVLINESKDNAAKEELSICFRYLVNRNQLEYFFCLRILRDLRRCGSYCYVIKSVLQSGLSAQLISLGAIWLLCCRVVILMFPNYLLLSFLNSYKYNNIYQTEKLLSMYVIE